MSEMCGDVCTQSWWKHHIRQVVSAACVITVLVMLVHLIPKSSESNGTLGKRSTDSTLHWSKQLPATNYNNTIGDSKYNLTETMGRKEPLPGEAHTHEAKRLAKANTTGIAAQKRRKTRVAKKQLHTRGWKDLDNSGILSVVNVGPGTTATRGLFHDLCSLGVRVTHWMSTCNVPGDVVDPILPVKALMNSVIACKMTGLCNRRHFKYYRPDNGSYQQKCRDCPSAADFTHLLEDVANTDYVEAFLDNPYPENAGEFVEFLLKNPRRARPKLILTLRDPASWASRRVSKHPKTPTCCSVDSTSIDVSPWSWTACRNDTLRICTVEMLGKGLLERSFRKHITWVRQFASQHSLDLLELNYFEDGLSAANRQKKIASFLGIPYIKYLPLWGNF